MSSDLQHGQQLYRHIYLGCKEEDNVHKNFELLFTTLAVLTIELANEEVVIDLIRLAIALQVRCLLSGRSHDRLQHEELDVYSHLNQGLRRIRSEYIKIQHSG